MLTRKLRGEVRIANRRLTDLVPFQKFTACWSSMGTTKRSAISRQIFIGSGEP
jgi:hypothetical protein